MGRYLKIVLILLFALILAAPAHTEARSAKVQGSVEDISVKEAAKLAKDKNVVIVDVRTPKEFASGHIAGAENIDLFGTRFEDQAGKLPKNKTILLYCRTGKRSAGAADLMKEAGLKVKHMNDGLEGWEKAKLPVVKD